MKVLSLISGDAVSSGATEVLYILDSEKFDTESMKETKQETDIKFQNSWLNGGGTSTCAGWIWN